MGNITVRIFNDEESKTLIESVGLEYLLPHGETIVIDAPDGTPKSFKVVDVTHRIQVPQPPEVDPILRTISRVA